MGRGRVILLEFNELCPQLMHNFMAEGQLPHFRRLYDQSHVYLTDAGEKAPNLEPWIQWVTVHSGIPFSSHKIFELGHGRSLQQPCIWDVLSGANRKVWICGSMNVRYDEPLNGMLVPDPWSSGVDPYPPSLMPYLSFVRANVQEHSNDQARLRAGDAARFLAFMASHGLSLDTLTAIARQLLSEKGSKNRWKRSTILDQLQFDVFRHFYRKLRPDFSTFFLNSTAHLQHMYWRNMDPALFKIQPSKEEQAEFSAAILFGYKQMDDLVGRLVRLAGSDTTIMFCTALSQQPCLIYDDAGGKMLYRPRDFSRLMSYAGLNSEWTIEPIMAEQFHVYFSTEQDALEGERRLKALRAGEEVAMFVARQGTSLLCGCAINRALSADTKLTRSEGHAVPFFEIFYQMEGIKSGMHHPDGLLWISTPDRLHQVHHGKAPLTAIAPTILDMFDLPHPDSMQGETLEPFARQTPAYALAIQ
jgi:hypothetical protein